MKASWRNALIIIALADVVGTAFGSSFTLALDRPKPHGVPAGIVNSAGVGSRTTVSGAMLRRPQAPRCRPGQRPLAS